MDEMKRIYRAVFDLHARHAPYPHTLEEWEEALDEILMISKLFHANPFVDALLAAVYDQMDRAQKAEKEGVNQ